MNPVVWVATNIVSGTEAIIKIQLEPENIRETIPGTPFIPLLGKFFQILCLDFVDESPIKKLQRIRTLKICSLEIGGLSLDWSNNFTITMFSCHLRITIGGSEWWILDRVCGKKWCSCEFAINDQLSLSQTFQVKAHRIYFLRSSWNSFVPTLMRE